jgi:hypothetical protein
MAYSTLDCFIQSLKEAAALVASDLMELDGIPSDVWDQLPEQFRTTNADGDEVVTEELLIAWFNDLIDNGDDWGGPFQTISEFADSCDYDRKHAAKATEEEPPPPAAGN